MILRQKPCLERAYVSSKALGAFMRDFNRGRSSGEVVRSSAPEVTPGKSTLVDRLCGIDGPSAIAGSGSGSSDSAKGSDRGAGTPAPPAKTAAVTITSKTTAGPTFGPQGAALWHVSFATTGRTGWIVQKIDNTLSGTDAHGKPMTPASVGLAPHYYEAWSVDATGAVTPQISGDNDYWDQGPSGANTKGTWSTHGELFWVAGATLPSGMTSGGVKNAGMLVSSASAPPGLGSSLLHRHATGTWDATVTPAVDRGTAGP
jgi:hypothetical protein